jgi:uncharacterized protein (TIGR02231 family)
METKEITTRVAKVVCMEDRAQVERRGELELTAGVHRIEAKKLSRLAVDRSLKVEVAGAKLLDAKLERKWLQKLPGGLRADATEQQKRLEAVRKLIVAIDDEVAAIAVRTELVRSARADLFRAISEQAGAGAADKAKWHAALAKVDAELEALIAKRHQKDVERHPLYQESVQLDSAIRATGQPEEDLECSLVLTVEAIGGKCAVRASYLVPCAVWRPAYRATLLDDSVKLESEAVIWQRTSEDWTQCELWCSTARPTLGTAPPKLEVDRLALRPKTQVEKKVVDVALREEVIQNTGAGGEEPEMPGLDDGGETRLLKAAALATVRSDGQPHRVPLAALDAKATLERVCSPELMPLVSLVARFPNSGANVLLAGPVDLIRRSGFVGRSQLKFAAVGETVQLSFGSEDTVRVTRNITDKIDEARLTGRRTTTRTVTLYLSNLSGEPQSMSLEERIPVSEVKEVEVRLLDKESKPAPKSVSKDGIAKFDVSLGPNAQQKLEFCWELSAASKVAGV